MPDTLFATGTGELADADGGGYSPFGQRVPFEVVVSQTGALSMADDSLDNQTRFVHGKGYWLFTVTMLVQALDADEIGNQIIFDIGPPESIVPVQGSEWVTAKGAHTIVDEEPHYVTFSGVVNGHVVDAIAGPNDETVVFVYRTGSGSGIQFGSGYCQVTAVSPAEGAVVGRNARTSNSPTFTGSLVRIMSTRAPVVNGRSYAVVVDGEVEMTTSGGATTQHEIRYTTNDVEPTTSDTVLGRTVTFQDPSGVPVGVHVVGYHHSSADGFLRAALCSYRPVGSNTGQWTAASGRPMTLEVVDLGPTVSTSGTVY